MYFLVIEARANQPIVYFSRASTKGNHMSIVLVLQVLAIVLFFLAAINWPPAPLSLGWLGVFFFALSVVLR